MNTQPRPAREEDFEELRRLYQQLQPSDPVLDDGSDRAVFDEILDNPLLHLLVLPGTDGLAATTYLNIIPNITRSAAPYAVIENVVTERALRGTGCGKRLMAYTLEFAWDAGCYKAMLMTGSERPETHAFYRSCGFAGDAKHAYLARPPG